MSARGFSVHPTPNPNSLKVTTTAGPFIESGMESFSSAREAQDHPLASALFGIPGVANVFILPEFMTVTKAPESSWETLWPAVAACLEQHGPR